MPIFSVSYCRLSCDSFLETPRDLSLELSQLCLGMHPQLSLDRSSASLLPSDA